MVIQFDVDARGHKQDKVLEARADQASVIDLDQPIDQSDQIDPFAQVEPVATPGESHKPDDPDE